MTAIAALGYLLSSLAFCVVSVWALIVWRGRPHTALLGISSLISAGYGAAVFSAIALKSGSVLTLECLELARSASWLTLLLNIIGSSPKATDDSRRSMSSLLTGTVVVLGALALVILSLHLFPHGLGNVRAGTVRSVSYVLASVAGMAFVEHLYRSLPHGDRWAVKFACLGIGVLFAYDFYLYSNATLFRALDADLWAARGFINVLVALLIALSFSRNPSWVSGLAISRSMLFRSTAVLGAACYMLVMAAAGYIIRIVGGIWGPALQLAFLVGALILLIAIMSSGTARAWLRVTIAKHFYRYNYDYREEWLRFTRTLSQEGPTLSERVIKAIGDLVESPGGSLWLLDERCFRQAASWNAPMVCHTEPAGSALCELMRRHQWIIDLDEPKSVPRGEPSIALPAWLGGLPSAKIIVPLCIRGNLSGYVVLMRPRSRISLDWEIFDLLRVASSQAASYLAEQQATEALIAARQFESFNRMSAFVLHDLKNLVSQLSLTVANAQRHQNDPEFQAELQSTLRHSVEKMRSLMQRFQHGQARKTVATILLDAVVLQAAAEKAALFAPRPEVELDDEGMMVLGDPVVLPRIIGHLLQNAIEATPAGGRVWARLLRSGDHAVIEIGDTGQGMGPDFLQKKLFKPFNSTKPSGMGIGVFESRTYIQELGGTLEVDSRLSKGTVFRITLPLYRCEGVTIENAA